MCLATERSRDARRRDPGKPTVARKAVARKALRGGSDMGASSKRQSPMDSAGLLGGRRTVKTQANGARLSHAAAYQTPHQVSKVNSLWV